MTASKRVGILISGRGSNMISLIEAMRRGEVPAEPAVVLSNVADAAGLSFARALGIPTRLVEHRKVKPRAAHDAAVLETLAGFELDVICLAGYMRLLTSTLIQAYPGRILNIHPSLLPAFPGLQAQHQALRHGVKLSGCTVHLVDEQCDHGPILAQASVPVLDDDSEASLSARILEQEHRIYPVALARFLRPGFRLDGRVARGLEASV